MNNFISRAIQKIACVQMILQNVFYISYAVPADKLQGLVPLPLKVATVDGMGFISLVILKSAGVHLSAIPFAQFNYNQINIRTYIHDPLSGKQAVFFLKSAVSSPIISLITRSIGLTWEHVPMQVKEHQLAGSGVLKRAIKGNWMGDFLVETEQQPNALTSIAIFADIDSAINFLVRPLTGIYGTEGNIKRFNIWHPPIMHEQARLHAIRFPLLEKMNIIDDFNEAIPHSVLFVPRAQFTIFLPPRRI